MALPLRPLLHAYRAGGIPSLADLHRLPCLGGRFAAVLGASARFLYPDFLQRASDDQLRDALVRFYEAAVSPPLHADTVRRRAGFLRHALAHLLHGQGPVAQRLDACVRAGGAYRVAGLGPSFWSALLQGLAPARHPGWTPAIRRGAERLGLAPPSAGPAGFYAALGDLHARLRAAEPGLTSPHIDHFLSLVAVMPGRNLLSGADALASCPVQATLQRLRGKAPLRQRLKERGPAFAAAQEQFRAALAAGDGKQLGDALAAADPAGAARCTLDWGRHAQALVEWVRPVWEADDPYPLLSRFLEADPLPGAGLWLLPAALHLRDPQRYVPFNDAVRQGLAAIDDGLDPADPPAERYRLANEAAAWLRNKHAVHPLEMPDLLAALGTDDEQPHHRQNKGEFGGFCADTFAFLDELARENRRDWMDQARDRYRFAVREPLLELCSALSRRYVEPTLAGAHGWRLDTLSRPGHALTRVCKNVFGRSSPYTSTLWITFCRPGVGRQGAQLFVRLSPQGLRFGLRLGKSARGDRDRLRAAVERHGEALFRLLLDNGAVQTCRFGAADHSSHQAIETSDDLRRWAHNRTLEASCELAPGDPLLGGDELVDRVLLAFDQLLPLYACCVEEEAASALVRLGGRVERDGYREADFRRQTFLGDDWLSRTRDLLSLKKQLILQGPPGTGKTHVARCLARLLTDGRDDCVRLVQFHPAYSYEEFVEGIRVRSVAVEGRHDVTYPVEDGLLCAFAARAASRPAQPHVLVIDEINRGNLPRIFGELLYLLEYRGSAVELPYSRRDFHLPPNLYLLATMNAADRSLALVDQALRRRFSFVAMDPDPSVLAAWLKAHPPADGPAFAQRVLAVFERLNARLAAEAGPQARVGHSYFMVEGLDEAKLRMVWQHHVRPLLDEAHAGQPGRAASYDALLDGGKSRSGRAEAVSSS
jgi:MoxR-like ATPase